VRSAISRRILLNCVGRGEARTQLRGMTVSTYTLRRGIRMRRPICCPMLLESSPISPIWPLTTPTSGAGSSCVVACPAREARFGSV